MTLHDLLLDHIRDTYQRTPATAHVIAGVVGSTLGSGLPLHDWLLIERGDGGWKATWFDDRDAGFRALGMAEALAIFGAFKATGMRPRAENVPRLVPVAALLEDVDRADTATLPDAKET